MRRLTVECNVLQNSTAIGLMSVGDSCLGVGSYLESIPTMKE